MREAEGEIIQHLIENGARIEERGKYGYTPLHIAAQNGYLLIFKYLNEKGANIDIKDQYGQTVFHHAVVNDHIHILKYLKENNQAKFDDKDSKELTPFHISTQNGQSRGMQGIGPLQQEGDELI